MRKRLTWAFIGLASGMVILATFIFIREMHHHFSLFLADSPSLDIQEKNFIYHMEQAIIFSSIWTAIGTIVLAIVISFFVAKKIATPLIDMRTIADKMAKGDWCSRVNIEGNDELAALGESLNHLTVQLQRQETLRKNLTSDIAHELRTPLATLKSHMEAFQDGVWEPTPEKIDSCYEEIERLIHLVGDLEQLTNVEAPDFTLDRKKENIKDIIVQCVNAMQSAFMEKKIDLYVPEIEDIFLFVDRNRIIQIIMNLLSNAVKYTNEGGQVSIRVKEKVKSVMIVIKDTGKGIQATEIPKVFERFYRVDKSRSRELGGSGIGLTIVKKLVMAHGGSIQIESKVGKGTTVYLLFQKNSA